MNIRHAAMADLDTLYAIEAASYPSAEGASRASLCSRLRHFADHFWVLENEEGEIVAFINGMCTDTRDLCDEMYDDAAMHRPEGSWMMIFSVVTAPEHRGKGWASLLMRQVIEDLRAAGKTGIVLTCKERLLGFYSRFGYVNEGVSSSTHGDVQWYQMRLML